ncbi:MAG: hypothetical protein OJF47_001369 [Nitrospira sp.]|jgi:hypothetical protein|nr:MAG: hypothetical protein OJF47_001369 [Nitrospira sp.]
MTISFRLGLRRFLTTLFICWTAGVTVEAADKVAGSLTVKDALTLPNQAVRIEAQLTGTTHSGGQAVGGVSLQLRIDGKPVATAKTNDGGQAFFDYRPKMRGTHAVSVTVDDPSPVEAGKAEATLFVWERRRPILLVEVAALMQTDGSTSSPGSTASTGKGLGPSAQPAAGAAEELSRLTQYYYNLVYLPGGDQSPTEVASVEVIRRWLASNRFPSGLVLMPVSGGLSAALDAFKQDGWTAMKTGIGRTRSFAELLLQHRMDVVVVPELPKGELPRKAKAAKDWKEVRKKL